MGKTRRPPRPLIGWNIFDFSSETAKRNSTNLDRKQDLNALYQVCFLGRSEKQDGRPGLWLAETFSTSPLKPLNRIQQNLTGSKISKPSTKFVFFGQIGKTRRPPRPLIGWDIFDFSSETAERNSTNLDRKQGLNALYQVCVFRADRKKNMAAQAYDLLRHFQLFLWDRWMEFNKTWQEARSQHPLPGLRFSGWSEKQVTALSSDWLRYFWLLWSHWTEFNKTWQKASSQRPLPSLCFSGLSKKQYGRPGLWFAETYFEFSSETAERNSAKLDGKQDLNVLYQVFFGPKCE